MPRRKTAVKTKHNPKSRSRISKRTTTGGPIEGLVDIHFHGAFGIDLMTAAAPELDRLSGLLWKNGIGAFCPTTLSVGAAELQASVVRLGAWMRSLPKNFARDGQGAIPLGLHLEGPFISPQASGAHPPGAIRPLDFVELERLWEASQGTVKILTLAPETLSQADLARVCSWAKKRKIVLSLGHSRASEAQARLAFDAGFTGVTHAWNAMNFHHRSPGVLGGAAGRKDVYLEIIPDGVHVDATVIRWTRKIHPRVCFVSDCAPAAATQGEWMPFGPLKIRLKGNACRLEDGGLAGGGLLLSEAFAQWLKAESKFQGEPIQRLLRETRDLVSENPLRALGFSPRDLKHRQIRWKPGQNGLLQAFPK